MEFLHSELSTIGGAVSYAVVEQVAKFKDEKPGALEPPLNDVIDPDALDSLFAPTGTSARDGTITFDYSGCRITVEDTGDIVVRDGGAATS